MFAYFPFSRDRRWLAIETALAWIFNWIIGVIGGLIILRSVINFLVYFIHRMSPKKMPSMFGFSFSQRTFKDVGIEFVVGVMIVGLFLSGRWIVVVNMLINFGNQMKGGF